MRRRTLDALVSTTGLVIAILLLIAGGLLMWAHSFVDNNVHTQLASQKIDFPPKGSPGLSADPEIKKYVTPYAGQQVTDGQQAQVFADHYIAVHLREIGGGKTYSEVSSKFLSMKPTDPNYQQVAQQRQTLFMGETLRGMLLNAYAFWKMGQIAFWAAIASFVGAGVLLVLALLGFAHARRVAPEADAFPAERRGRTTTDTSKTMH
jgi:hypothetical protein